MIDAMTGAGGFLATILTAGGAGVVLAQWIRSRGERDVARQTTAASLDQTNLTLIAQLHAVATERLTEMQAALDKAQHENSRMSLEIDELRRELVDARQAMMYLVQMVNTPLDRRDAIEDAVVEFLKRMGHRRG